MDNFLSLFLDYYDGVIDVKNHGDGSRDTEYIMAYVYCTFQKSKYVHCTLYNGFFFISEKERQLLLSQ